MAHHYTAAGTCREPDAACGTPDSAASLPHVRREREHGIFLRRHGEFRILALDGGGIRGALAASFLAEVERYFRQRSGNPQLLLRDCFDLIAGTSTGGIIAAGLATDYDAAQMRDFYQATGRWIFPRRFLNPGYWLTLLALALVLLGLYAWGQSWHSARCALYTLAALCVLLLCLIRLAGPAAYQLLLSKYSPRRLRLALAERFGQRRMNDARIRLLLPAFDIDTGKTKVFKTTHEGTTAETGRVPVVDAVLSTTAAPTYFTPSAVEVAEGELDLLIDGGLWANNPAIVAYVEYEKIRQALDARGLGISSVKLLSIGTGRHARHALRQVFPGFGLLWWGTRLIQTLMEAQADGTQYMLRQLFCAAPARTAASSYVRVNFDLPRRLRGLDCTSRINELLARGRDMPEAVVYATQDCPHGVPLHDKQLILERIFSVFSI